MKKLFVTGLLVALGVVGFMVPSVLAHGNPEKVTICHAAGLAGTTKYVTLTISYNAVYGPGGHFNENGTTQAGHEEDYLGPCEGDETETTDTETTETETTTTTDVDRCPPGEGPFAGKDGEPGNQECCPDVDNNQKCDETIENREDTTEGAIPPSTTPPSPPSSSPPSVVVPQPRPVTPEKPLTKKEMQKAVEKQANKNGAQSAPHRVSATNSEELPFTGLPLALLALLGSGMVSGGLGLLRLSR